jgi:hypothetical protein
MVVYEPGNQEHETLIDEYIKTTPIVNNQSRKSLKIHLYDGKKGILFMLIHKQNGTIDALSSCVRYDERFSSAKVWHRFHIKDNVPNSCIDVYFEKPSYEWCLENGITRLWHTFNEGNERVAFWAAKRIGERRNILRPNKFTNMFGHEIRTGWRPHNKLIYEMTTWQYVFFYSPDDEFFLDREERPLSDEAIQIFKGEFPNATQNWN